MLVVVEAELQHIEHPVQLVLLDLLIDLNNQYKKKVQLVLLWRLYLQQVMVLLEQNFL